MIFGILQGRRIPQLHNFFREMLPSNIPWINLGQDCTGGRPQAFPAFLGCSAPVGHFTSRNQSRGSGQGKEIKKITAAFPLTPLPWHQLAPAFGSVSHLPEPQAGLASLFLSPLPLVLPLSCTPRAPFQISHTPLNPLPWIHLEAEGGILHAKETIVFN